MRNYEGDLSTTDKCLYYKDGVFDFIQNGGKCWGESILVREGGYIYNEEGCDSNHYYNEIWLCQGHIDYQNYPKKFYPKPEDYGEFNE